MSGSFSLDAVDYASLFSAPDVDSVNPVLQALYGTGGSAPAGPGDAVAALKNAEANQSQQVAAIEAQPAVARDIATFTAAVQSATSPQQLLNNPTVLNVLLTASGLGSQVGFTALAQKALLSDTNDPQSLANTLPDTAWATTAATYQFATQGLAVIQQPSVIATVTNAYAEAQWQQSLNATYPGLSDALTFRAQASSITSVQQILGDSVLFDVVTTALGIPTAIVEQPLQAQEQTISAQLNVKDFQQPSFTEQFLQQYLINNALNQTGTTAPSLTQLAATAQGLIA
jgi:hypothetical protein